jgi:DNA-binding response OmpR family regulator
MPKRVLDVGQCGPDHAAISRLLRNGFGVEVDRAEGADDCLSALAAHDYALVLVNRKLDRDYSDGMAVLRAVRGRAEWADVPVMLVSNYPEAHAAAVAEGAVPGFGKDHLHDAATLSLLEPYLAG